jgi:hypothetical protein
VRLVPISSADRIGGYLSKVGVEDEQSRTPSLELARSDLKAGRSWGRAASVPDAGRPPTAPAPLL